LEKLKEFKEIIMEKEVLSHIDYTLLKADANFDDIERVCSDALRYHTASACIPQSYVRRISRIFPELDICTVVGFPLGYSFTHAKAEETRIALENGAREIDMVINIGDVKNRDYAAVEREIAILKEICGKRILKVIVEACYLTTAEKIMLCEIITAVGADFIKTSTGFGSGGATFKDIELFSQHIGPKVQMKAAGGVRTLDEMHRYLELGVSRIGASSIKELI
jgi:deoxyribose-phosphate aldolase